MFIIKKKSWLAGAVFVFCATVIISSVSAHAQKVEDGDEKSKRERSYTEVLYMNTCSRYYYNYFNPGDKLDAKGERQMISHIRASCQCMYDNLNQVFSEADIMQYVQSQYVSRQTTLKQYGDTPDRVYKVMTSEELREKCNHLIDYGASDG